MSAKAAAGSSMDASTLLQLGIFTHDIFREDVAVT
jgi:hypothetical protein